MLCGACGHQNAETARFCEQCGTPLGPPAAVDPLARPPPPLAQRILRGRPSLEGERKQITVMFSDIVRSMELAGGLDTERWRVVLERFFVIACRSVHSVEGTVHQFTGDGVMALFGAPLAHEDHARRACLAALKLQNQLEPLAREVSREHGLEFLVRCGLDSGEVVVGSIGDDLQMDYASIGNTNGVAKRMESLAPAGSTALSAATAALVEGEFERRELGEFQVPGVKRPQPVFELIGRGAVRTRLEAAEMRGLTRFVGRNEEKEALEDALRLALAGEGQVVGIVGEPGVGKSRLCRELVRRCEARRLMVTTASAVSHGRAVPLLPVLAMLRDFFRVRDVTPPEEARQLIRAALIRLDAGSEPDLPLLFDFLGIPDPDRPPEHIDPEARQRRLLAFVGRLVEARSRREPAVIVIEDLHWIDDASGAFLVELVRAVSGTRTLLVVTFRPEYEPDWGESSPYRKLALSPLDEEASGELLEALLGDDSSLDRLAELIRRRSAGNPFFIEEAVQALAETGHLSGEGGAYRLAGPLEELALPPTVQAVLAARIDRLPPREKGLVQTMSVIGRDVPDLLLREVAELDANELVEAIGTLTEAGLLNPPRVNGYPEHEFKHPLTQEVAYGSQLSEPRARAHAAVARAIERVYADALDERAALLAHHTEAAGEKVAAAQWHARAAAWVSDSSPAEGLRHWRRVRELTDELASSPEVDGLAVLARISILALAWRLGMGHDEIAAIHAEGRELTGGPGLRSAEIPPEKASPSIERTLLDVAYAANLTSKGRVLAGLELYRAASAQAESIGDPGLVLNVTVPRAYSAWVAGLFLEGLECVDRALAVAGEDVSAGAGLVLGNPYAHALWIRALCLTDLGRWPEAEAEFERSIQLAREHGDAECECFAYAARPHLHEHLGGEECLSGAEGAVELAGRVGSQKVLAAAYAGLALASADRGLSDQAADAGERSLSIARHQRMNLELEPETEALLARAKLGLGEVEEARAMAEEAVGIADERSLTRQAVVARVALAQVLLAIGEPSTVEEAQDLLDAASELAARIGFKASQPNIHRVLAALARLRGDEETADREEAEAERILAELKASGRSSLSLGMESGK
jgi:class 3 adenylate cyclase/tetratricopeptide (TPR) repeat protein